MMNEELIGKWLRDELTESEKAEFENSEEFRSLQGFLDRLEYFRAPEYDVEAALQQIRSRLSVSESPTHSETRTEGAKAVSISWLGVAWRAAAAVALIAVVYVVFLRPKPVHMSTGPGESQAFYLPDSSRVVMNANTTIIYKPAQWTEDRSLTLAGEAYFSVRDGSDFRVRTTKGLVTVLGTRFNVVDRQRFFEVLCYEGLVKVEAEDQSYQLERQQYFRLVDGESSSGSRTDLEPDPSWTRESSSFVSVPFHIVVTEFENQFGIEVETSGFDTGQRFTGSFDHQDIDLALEAISRPLNLTYSVLPDGRIALTSRE